MDIRDVEIRIPFICMCPWVSGLKLCMCIFVAWFFYIFFSKSFYMLAFFLSILLYLLSLTFYTHSPFIDSDMNYSYKLIGFTISKFNTSQVLHLTDNTFDNTYDLINMKRSVMAGVWILFYLFLIWRKKRSYI